VSVTNGTTAFVADILRRWKGPAVLDADALTIAAKSGIIDRPVKGRDWIVTPHTGEFSRMTGRSTSTLERERCDVVRWYASRKKVVTLLKGSPTCVASDEETCYINPTGNPGMATVGSGDVLAGLLAGLRAQGMASVDAAWSAAYVHGLAGDLARDMYGERSILAEDILENVPVAFTSVGSGRTA
jgi:NAD(P)H-hydrate epimerase